MAVNQARRLLEPLEMIKLVHEKLVTGFSVFEVRHCQKRQSRADRRGVVDVGRSQTHRDSRRTTVPSS